MLFSFILLSRIPLLLFFFFNDTATTEIYTLSLHDALPISRSIEVAPGSVVELDPRHATGERLGGLELRCDHHRAGRIDIPVLAVDRERSQSLGEPLCPIRLRKPHHYLSPAVRVTPQHPRRPRGPPCDCRSAIGEAPDAVELRGNHDDAGRVDVRSEEHTSELQSQSNLVCRLLLEKKKKLTRSPRPAETRRPRRDPLRWLALK